jgi:hypothetical protein
MDDRSLSNELRWREETRKKLELKATAKKHQDHEMAHEMEKKEM